MPCSDEIREIRHVPKEPRPQRHEKRLQDGIPQIMSCSCFFFFFFQAEDGIRDLYVTGVQTCALPIYRRNGALNPYAHLQQGDITLEKVLASPMLWDPVRYDETCPSSDGACAVVIGDSSAAAAAPGPVAWIRATAMRSEPTMFAGKDHVNPAAGRECVAALWRQAGITDPLDEIDVAEIYVPFSWYEPMWLENLGFAAAGDGWRLTEAGETAIGGRLPVNPSGGVLSSNPIGASGLLRFAESALQVMGEAGAHQVPGARVALGHAYGGGSQFFSMWVVSADATSDVENGA